MIVGEMKLRTPAAEGREADVCGGHLIEKAHYHHELSQGRQLL